MENVQWKADGMSLKMYLCFVYGSRKKSANPFPRKCTHAHTWNSASHFRGPVTLQNPPTVPLAQTMSNKLRMKTYRLGSLMHGGYLLTSRDSGYHRLLLTSRILPFLVPTFLSNHYFSISLFGSYSFPCPVKLGTNQESRISLTLFCPLYRFSWLIFMEILWISNEIIRVLWTAQSLA